MFEKAAARKAGCKSPREMPLSARRGKLKYSKLEVIRID